MAINNNYKKELFMHLDGITIIPTVVAMKQLGILTFIGKQDSFNISDITNTHVLSKGYLNIAIRNLLSIGLLSIDNNEKYLDNKKYYVHHDKLNLIDCN